MNDRENASGRSDAGDAIDAVYTWVDSRDLGFRAALRGCAPASGSSNVESGSAELRRFQEHGELRYSIRSLFACAPWIRQIHILTNGQSPAWLDCSHPQIHLVSHSQVFPDPGVLPTFNSNAIEMCLHHIPGLARRFIYFNDDVFLGRCVRPDDFFLASGGARIYLENMRLPNDMPDKSPRDRSLVHTERILDRYWGEPSSRRLLTAHAPQAYDRDKLYFLEGLLYGEFRSTASHRFRCADDLVLSVLYAYAQAPEPGGRERDRLEVLPWGSEQYCFLMLESKPLWALRGFVTILHKRPKFFCINDDARGRFLRQMLYLGMRIVLQSYMPARSAAERSDH